MDIALLVDNEDGQPRQHGEQQRAPTDLVGELVDLDLAHDAAPGTVREK